MIWVLMLNDMRSTRAGFRTPVCWSVDKSKLEELLASEHIGYYEDGVWKKQYKMGGPLEWYNPPSSSKPWESFAQLEGGLPVGEPLFYGSGEPIPCVTMMLAQTAAYRRAAAVAELAAEAASLVDVARARDLAVTINNLMPGQAKAGEAVVALRLVMRAIARINQFTIEEIDALSAFADKLADKADVSYNRATGD